MRFLLLAALATAGAAFGWASFSAATPRWIGASAFALACAILLPRALKRGVAVGDPDIFVLVAFGYAAVSVAWSEDWRQGVYALQCAFPLLAAFWFGRHGDTRNINDILALCVIATAGFFWLFPDDYGGHGNPNFAVEFVLIALPLAWGSRLFCLAAVATVAVLVLSPAKIGPFVALGWALLVLYRRAGGWWASGGLLMVLAAWFVGRWAMGIPPTEDSILVRVEIWLNSLRAFVDNPLFGSGLGGFEQVYVPHREWHLGFGYAESVLARPWSYVGAAHNEYLQVFVEFGLAGALIAAVFLWACLCRAKDIPALVAVFNVSVISLIEFPLQNPQTGMVFALALGVASKGNVSLGWRPAGWRWGYIAVLPALVVMWGAVQAHLGLMYYTTAILERTGNPVAAFQSYMKALAVYPLRSEQRRQSMVLFNDVANSGRDVTVTDKAADRIFAAAQSAARADPAALILRAEYLINSGRWREAGDEMEAIISSLHRNARLVAQTWLIEAAWAHLTGNEHRKRNAIAEAKGLRFPQPEVIEELERLQ